MQLVLECWNVLLELAPWLIFGAMLSCLLHKFVPKTLIKEQLSGRMGVLKSVFFGIPLPLCSCSVIPTGLGLRKQGSSDGATVGFLIATPQTGVDSIMVSANFLGWPFAIFKVVAALITGLVGGLLVKESSPQQGESTSSSQSTKPTWGETFEHGIDLIRSIWKWLVLGVVLSALITMLLPANGMGELIDTHAGGQIGASLIALLISVPLYVCATASVPIAAALVHGGLPLGAALVFLMAGPATNVATIGAVRAELGNRTTVVYLTTVIVGSLFLGLGFEVVLDLFNIPVFEHTDHEHHTWWAQMSAVMLLSLWGYYLLEEIQVSNNSTASDDAQIFIVEGMTCGGCVNRLQKVLERTEGVESATVTLEPGAAHVTSSLSPQAIVEVIESAGFDVPKAS